MNEHDAKTARVLAEMMGWHVATEDSNGYKYTEAWWCDETGMDRIRVADYNPRHNLQQAWDAAEKFGLFNVNGDTFVDLSKDVSGTWLVSRVVELGYGEYTFDLLAQGATPAAAICDAIMAAIEEE